MNGSSGTLELYVSDGLIYGASVYIDAVLEGTTDSSGKIVISLDKIKTNTKIKATGGTDLSIGNR